MNTSLDPHPHHADVGAAPPVKPVSTRRMVLVGVGLVVVLIALFIMAFLPRRAVSKELAAEAAAGTTPPLAEVMIARRAPDGALLQLPGTIQALHEGAVYARVSGYVKRWNVDIGTRVHAGQVLAEIDAPELSQQVEQAQSQSAQAKASLGLARADLDRWKQLAADSAVTRQELDQKQAAFESANANAGAADANLRRLVAMEGFTRLTAPFSGVVTARNIDIGSLISASGATSAAVAGGAVAQQGAGSLFQIAQNDTVRTYVQVPENYATVMRAGLPAQVDVQEIPNRAFIGHVVRTSAALDAASRTMLTEVDIPNPGFVLLPGMYANVRFQMQQTTPPVVIPSFALVIRSAGTQVMVVDDAAPDHAPRVHLRNVQTGRDFGSTIEILSGLSEGDRVIVNPSADMSEGMRIQLATSADSAQHIPARSGTH